MNDNVSRKLSPEEAFQAFLTPRRPQNPVPLVMPNGESLFIETPDGTMALQRAGFGPKVLLLHGWEGQASDLATFSTSLLEAGFEVLAIHLPAHGDSNGAQTCIPHSARQLSIIIDAVGPLHAAIAHSVGSAILVEAMHGGLSVSQAVLIAAPAHYEDYARSVATAVGLDAENTQAMLDLLSTHMGVDIGEVSIPRRAQSLQQAALFIHSADDRVVSIEDSLASAANWPNARHMRVEGLGHRRILSDASVITAAIEFIATSN